MALKNVSWNQNLTDTDSTSIFFFFICNLASDITENEARKTIF